MASKFWITQIIAPKHFAELILYKKGNLVRFCSYPPQLPRHNIQHMSGRRVCRLGFITAKENCTIFLCGICGHSCMTGPPTLSIMPVCNGNVPMISDTSWSCRYIEEKFGRKNHSKKHSIKTIIKIEDFIFHDFIFSTTYFETKNKKIHFILYDLTFVQLSVQRVADLTHGGYTNGRVPPTNDTRYATACTDNYVCCRIACRIFLVSLFSIFLYKCDKFVSFATLRFFRSLWMLNKLKQTLTAWQPVEDVSTACITCSQ